MRWLSLITGVLLTAASVGLIACAGPTTSRPPAGPSGATMEQPPSAPPIDPRVLDISAYFDKIRDWRREMGLNQEPDADAVQTFIRQGVGTPPDICEPTTQTCTDSCDLAEHICDNADDICSISRDLRNNPSYGWARDKCNSAKLSCKQARQQCCGCIDKEKTGGDVGQSSTNGKESSSRFWN